MKSIIAILSICILTACSKETFFSFESDDSKSSTANFLQFDIQEVKYDGTNTEEYSISMKQVENQTFELTDMSAVPRYLWFAPYMMPEDSLMLLGKVAFELETELDLPYKNIDMEFSFMEAKSKLYQLTDSTYQYKSLGDFHTLSKNTSWGEAYDGKAFSINNIMITVPEPVYISVNNLNYISSNGFYFEDEIIQASTGFYNEEEQSMSISGGFNVKIKELSCGFYVTHDVRNARFQVKLQ